jgi:hypothetical protein
MRLLYSPQTFSRYFMIKSDPPRKSALGNEKQWENRLYYQGKLYLLDHPLLCLRVLQQHHNLLKSGYFGQAKIFELIAWAFIWFGIGKDIVRYLCNYHICQYSRTTWQHLARILKAPLVPSKLWTKVSIDFITRLL